MILEATTRFSQTGARKLPTSFTSTSTTTFPIAKLITNDWTRNSEQMPEIDVFVAGIGTGGTICGVGKYLKRKQTLLQSDRGRSCRIDCLRLLQNGANYAPHLKLIKLKESVKTSFPKTTIFSVIDDMIQVEDKESFLMTRDLLTKEGLYSGISSGSAVVGAMKWVRNNLGP